MATIDYVKHLSKYAAGATDGARRDTLQAEVPLLIGAGHYLAVVVQRSPTAGDGDGAIT